MAFKKLIWTLKRHPFLYLTRFRLLSKNTDIKEIEHYAYNLDNPKKDIPTIFYEINDQIFENHKSETDLKKVTLLCIWLNKHIKGGPGLSEPSDKALEIMLNGKGGVCSDMVQIFNNFCVINDIQVREWGTTSAPFSRENGGHSFNEVYVKELAKWVLIDPSWGMLFYKEHGEGPLSVLEVYNFSRSEKIINYQSFIEDKVMEEAQVSKNYLNPDITPFLICEYSNKIYDRYLKIARPYVPVFIIHFWVYLTGKSYHYKFPLDDYKKIFS